MNIANPLAMINASADMLEHLGLVYHATVIRNSIHKVLNEARIHTPDLGGTHHTTDVIDFILKDVQAQTSI